MAESPTQESCVEEPALLAQSGLFEEFQNSLSYDESCKIRITDVIIAKKGLKKHAEYLIVGEDEIGAIEIRRRYKEFLHLRKLLASTWPGCYIPQVPPKKFFGNLKPCFMEKRKKLLELFLKKLSCLQFLRNSTVFTHFLKTPGSFLQATSEFVPLTLRQLNREFKANFIDTLIGSESNEINEYIERSLAEFEDSLGLLKKLKFQAKQTIKAHSLIGRSLNRVFRHYAELSQVFHTHTGATAIEITERKVFFNPHHIVLDWARGEILDLRAIFSAVQDLRHLENQLEATNTRLNKTRQQLNELRAGNRSVSAKLSRKRVEDLLAVTEQRLEEDSHNVLCLTELVAIITARLGKKDIHRLKAKLWKKLRWTVQAYVAISVEEFQASKAQATFVREQLES